MNIAQWLLTIIVLITLIPVISNRLRIDIAALVMAVALGLLQLFGFGMLGPEHSPGDSVKAISGFSEPVVITLVSLFILTRGLEKSGATRWLAELVLKFGGRHESRLIMLLALLTAGLSLFMNNLAAGALVLPIGMETSRRTGIRPSKFLIPVAYGSLLGGSATYFTTANIIMSNLLTVANPPQSPLRILDFTPTGGMITIVGILFLGLFGKRILPDRPSSSIQNETRRTVEELENLYAIGERSWDAKILPQSSLITQTMLDSRIGETHGVSIVTIRRDSGIILFPTLDCTFLEGDILHIIGREERVLPMKELGLEITAEKPDGDKTMRGVSYLEILLAPHSSLEGLSLRQINFRQKFGISVVALKRGSRSYRTDVGDIPLKMGDSLLAIEKMDHISTLKNNTDFILIEPGNAPEGVNRKQALLSMILIAGGIAASLAGMPIYLAMLSAAVLSLLLKIIPVEETYQSIEWQAIFLIAGMYAVSLAMIQTGLADRIGNAFISLTNPFGALGLAAGAYLLTGLLTQFVGGQVSALISGPITISAAISMGINPQAIAVATAIGCSASFLTPMAHPVNILMISPANYKFSDFFRIGWVLTIISFIMLMIGMLIFWGLYPM